MSLNENSGEFEGHAFGGIINKDEELVGLSSWEDRHAPPVISYMYCFQGKHLVVRLSFHRSGITEH